MMTQYEDLCQSCNAVKAEWIPLNEEFSECGACGVYRNNMNLLEDRPIPRDIKTKIGVQEIKSGVEKFTPILTRLEKIVPEQTMYDVACGCGAFAWLAKANGWRSGGCDINLSHQREAKKVFGVDIDIGFDNVNFQNKIGCFVFHHGIEHVDSPRKTLQKALDNLISGGIVYLQHPVMPYDREFAKKLVNKGHQYEWTFNAFKRFLRQWDLETLYGTFGDFDGVIDIPPSQEWIVRKK